MAESSAKRPAVDRLDGPDDGKRLRQNSPPPQNVEELPSFHGKIVQRGENGYQAATYQYASSGNLGVWGPSAVIYAAKDNDHSDIKKAIDYAVQHKVSIAVRSGGHQYLGFSSTTDQNIQIDMSEYDYWDDSNVSEEKGSTLIMGPKWRLSEIAKKCAELKIFFPHGECSHVAVGGHCQTGGYSVFSHSFGMFIDYITWFEIITADKEVRKVQRPDVKFPNTDNDDLWFSVLGGSPGNFGIVIRLQVQVMHDDDYKDSRGLFHFLPFKKDTLQDFLELLEETNDDDTLSSNYNYSIMAITAGGFHKYSMDESMNRRHPELFGPAGLLKDFARGILPSMVIVMAAFTGVVPEERSKADAWFAKINKAIQVHSKKQTIPELMEFGLVNKVLGVTNTDKWTPMSVLEDKCVWRFSREFNLPFQKRVYLGTARNLKQRGFARWATEKSWLIQGTTEETGVKLGAQWIAGGGKESAQGPSKYPTALGHRIPWAGLCAFDFFYETHKEDGSPWAEPFEFGTKWLDTDHDSVVNTAVGRNGQFSTDDYRFLYAPWGPKDEPWSTNVNLDNMWHYFFDDHTVYEKVLQTKLRFDPDHVFTPNSFCVGYNDMVKKRRSRTAVDTTHHERILKDRAHTAVLSDDFLNELKAHQTNSRDNNDE